MTPHSVGQADQYAGQKKFGSIPPDWNKFAFDAPLMHLSKINVWLAEHMDKSWHVCSVHGDHDTMIVYLALECKTDAVMFRLRGGETAWHEEYC